MPVAKKPVPKKSVPKKSVPKKSVPKKASAKKTTPKKSVPKKPTPKKSVPKKPTPPSRVDPTSDAALRALPVDYAACPDLPVEIAKSELASLARLAQAKQAQLVRVGIPTEALASLARFATRLSALEKAWQTVRGSVHLSASERKLRTEAEALDSKLLAGGRWALRGDKSAQTELTRIAEGASLTDTISDLRDLCDFWKKHEAQLGKTDITPADLSRARQLADKLEAAAAKEQSSLTASEALDLRNRCFWAADELAKEVREAGRYAFRLQPKIAAQFTSRYRTAIQRRSRTKTKPPEPTPTP